MAKYKSGSSGQTLGEAANVFDQIRAATSRGGDHTNAAAMMVAIEKVIPNPLQVRQNFDLDKLEELAGSIRAVGILEPLGVRRQNGIYQLIYGERRRRAAELAGLSELPVVIHNVDDQTAAAMMIAENNAREGIDVEDEGRFYTYLISLFTTTERGLAKLLGVSHNYVSRRVRLSQRPDICARLRDGEITQRQALSIIGEDESGEGRGMLLERGELDEVYHGDTPHSSNVRGTKPRPFWVSRLPRQLTPPQTEGERRELVDLRARIDELLGE